MASSSAVPARVVAAGAPLPHRLEHQGSAAHAGQQGRHPPAVEAMPPPGVRPVREEPRPAYLAEMVEWMRRHRQQRDREAARALGRGTIGAEVGAPAVAVFGRAQMVPGEKFPCDIAAAAQWGCEERRLTRASMEGGDGGLGPRGGGCKDGEAARSLEERDRERERGRGL